MEVRKINPAYIKKVEGAYFALRPVFVVIGLAASESKLNLCSLFRVVLIGI